jgi:hypothetical protein
MSALHVYDVTREFQEQLRFELKLECKYHASTPIIAFLHLSSFVQSVKMTLTGLLQQLISNPILFIYQVIQYLLDKILSPTPPPPGATLGRPKIAVIGAGLTGVSAASHCVGHGFETTIFEAGGRKALGGIWAVRIPRENSIPRNTS